MSMEVRKNNLVPKIGNYKDIILKEGKKIAYPHTKKCPGFHIDRLINYI